MRQSTTSSITRDGVKRNIDKAIALRTYLLQLIGNPYLGQLSMLHLFLHPFKKAGHRDPIFNHNISGMRDLYIVLYSLQVCRWVNIFDYLYGFWNRIIHGKASPFWI